MAITVLPFIIIRLVVVVFIHMGLIKFIGRYRIKVLSLKIYNYDYLFRF